MVRRALASTAIAFVLSACNLQTESAAPQDNAEIQTQAVAMVATQFSLQITQTALAVPPTPFPSLTPLPAATFAGIGTPFAFNTIPAALTPLASAAPSTQVSDPCHQSAFVADVNVPDGTIFRPGHQFNKRWQIMNTGTCTWKDGFRLKYLGGVLAGEDVRINEPLEYVKPGEIQEYMVDLIAPTKEGRYYECWKMQDDRGYFFGVFLCVDIIVD